MDRGDPEPVETTFELDLTPDETPGEAGPVEFLSDVKPHSP
jgi:hypothetical protein